MAQPKYAIVDPADYKRLRGYEWITRKGTNSFHARRYVARGKGKRATIVYMHQEILEVPKGMVVDHINNDGMDNRSANIRAATRAQNMCNKRKCSGPTYSKYKGAHWHKHDRKWHALITFEKKRIYLGRFDNEIEAARKYHGEFANLNFPE